MFVASLEGVSELFIAGVEVEDGSEQLGKEKELGGVVVEKGVNGTSNGVPKTSSSVNGGVAARKPVANGVKSQALLY